MRLRRLAMIRPISALKATVEPVTAEIVEHDKYQVAPKTAQPGNKKRGRPKKEGKE